MNENRPSPDELLERVQKEERLESKGKLKIYLGAAPGVGKTYTMLQDSIARLAQGLDVMVGVVESHGRKEIESLIQNLEIIPPQLVEYRGKQLKEFDLDAALKRHPALILIDEMAHTNAPGIKHKKRWQDIEELLNRGINVSTTLNVQHIESLNDVVSNIIHIHISETVPDKMLEIADTIELVDLPPEELLKRLQEGKVYIPEQAELAKSHFFRKGNLIALRELALRITAERVRAQVLLYRQDEGIQRIWETQRKILVCVSHKSSSAKLIRVARRMAWGEFETEEDKIPAHRSEWIAVHVDSTRAPLSEANRNIAIENLRLAERLGAQTKMLTGWDIAKEVMNFAREQNASTIIVGKKIRPHWKEIFYTDLADQIIHKANEIEVSVISTEGAKQSVDKFTFPEIKVWRKYTEALGIVFAATIINLIFFPYLNASNLIMVYLLAVTIMAMPGLRGPVIFGSILSVITYEFFFIPPFYTFIGHDWEAFFTLICMLLVSQVIGNFTVYSRRQANVARSAEQRTDVLHALSRKLASTRGVEKLLDAAARYIGDMFDSDILFLLPDEQYLLRVKSYFRTTDKLSSKEQAVAQNVFDMGQAAGKGTDTLDFLDALYLPLVASKGILGILRIHPLRPDKEFSPGEMHLLESCANHIAAAIEVDRIQDQAKQSELQNETDAVRNALLKSVSHDLRAPLISVLGHAHTLMEVGSELDGRGIIKLGTQIYSELDQLDRLINNILRMSYLDVDNVELKKSFGNLNDLITVVVQETREKTNTKINVKLPYDLRTIPFDPILLQEVFNNLIDNAIKFTEPKTPIDITVSMELDKVIVTIEDRGPGITADEADKLFDKYYRGKTSSSIRGMGLGLTICKKIIKAHHGKIWAENREGGGASFHFSLPLTL